jgi:Asp-tRNA(Asn)/Glu-tRNA(Gln) amidotransferase A subunit family amidase
VRFGLRQQSLENVMTEASTPPAGYDPATFKGRSFHDARADFVNGDDTPRAYLERCLESMHAREPEVKAWVVTDEEAARAAADASTRRYRAGRPLALVDGLPIGIKDLIETRDFPTQMGSPLYEGYRSHRDSACVFALRSGGAAVLGKTVTTELGMSHPGPTTNPFDATRTPGGSSSGSAAAVGARMVPACMGTQVVGSVIRPAAFCGNYAIKPTFGALNRGERTNLSQSHLGVHAGCMDDMWEIAWHISRIVGGDPGHPGLFGQAHLGQPLRPDRLALVETEGWSLVEDATRTALSQLLERLTAAGVEIVRRHDHPGVEAFERSIADASGLCRDVCGYEMRWQLWNWRERGEELLSPSMRQRLDMAEHMLPEDYRARLEERDTMRRSLQALAPAVDALITLSCPGPAPSMADSSTQQDAGISHTTGLPAFNAFTSAVGAPAITLPLMGVTGMPVGIQLIGQWHGDWRLASIARWVEQVAGTISV